MPVRHLSHPSNRSRSTSERSVIDAELLVHAYSEGLFPMAMEDGDIGWFSPDPRCILPLDRFHVPSRLARVMRQQRFTVRVDTAFDEVMRGCAENRDEGTWINGEIFESYVMLHRLGLAHSIEVWQEDRLVGGLYGVHLAGAFFGESMFHRVTDASKIALASLVERLNSRGFSLLDCQWTTPHLARFGAVEIPREDYLRRLDAALRENCGF